MEDAVENHSTCEEGVQRYLYIDWLRIFAVLLLFPFHTARIFDPWPFYVKSETVNVALVVFVLFLNQWHMHLFFFLPGASTSLALRFRSEREYVGERFRRLVVPFLFGILVIIPPQCYYRLFGDPHLVWPSDQLQFFIGGPQFNKSYLAFYPDFFNGIFPRGNFEWGHLWFLAYLFVFSRLGLPLFRYLRSGPGLRFIGKMAEFVQKPASFISFFIPIAVIEASLRGLYPSSHNLYNDWANFLTFGILFVYGYLFFCTPKSILPFPKCWPLSLAIALITSAACFGFLMPSLLQSSLTPYSRLWTVLRVLGALSTWCWVISLMGLGKTFFDFGGRFLRYVRQSALPIYILHQTIIIVIGFYILKTGVGVMSSYVIVIAASLVTSVLIYEGIRRNNMLRFFFGMKRN